MITNCHLRQSLTACQSPFNRRNANVPRYSSPMKASSRGRPPARFVNGRSSRPGTTLIAAISEPTTASTIPILSTRPLRTAAEQVRMDPIHQAIKDSPQPTAVYRKTVAPPASSCAPSKLAATAQRPTRSSSIARIAKYRTSGDQQAANTIGP